MTGSHRETRRFERFAVSNLGQKDFGEVEVSDERARLLDALGGEPHVSSSIVGSSWFAA